MLHNGIRLVFALILVLAGCGARPRSTGPIRPELLNWDFSAPLDSGWHREIQNYDGRSEIQARPEGGVLVRKTLCGRAGLTQAVAVADIDKVFRTRASFAAGSSRLDYYARAGLGLVYLDSSGGELGETQWYLATGGPRRESGPNRRFIPVPRSGEWLDLELDIADELRRNLTGIDPSEVRAVRIAFEAFGSGTGGC